MDNGRGVVIGADETDGRASDADSPGDIPGRGWWDVLQRLGRSLARDEIWLRAAGVAFCAIFAAIPGAAAPVSLLGLIAEPEAVHRPVEMLRGLLPAQASKFLADQMQAIAATSTLRLGAGLGAVLAALWGAWSGASAVIGALNLVYGEREARSFLRRQVVALTVAMASGLFSLVAFVLVAVLPLALEVLPLDAGLRTAISIARWPALAVLMVAARGMLHRIAPCPRAANWRWVRPGATVAAALWLAGSAGFSYYVATVPSYNQTLGALGMLMLLLTWFYLTAFAVLLGAELNVELEHQTTRDTTEGSARPLGRRGAAAADTVVRWR